MSQKIGRTALAYARSWHHVDATNRILGRLATSIAITLMGKHKPIFDQSADCGDYVVVTNADQFIVTGRKKEFKVYRHHTTRPGSLHEITMQRLMERKGGAEIIRKAVSRMLPKNRLREPRLARLKCYEGENHPFKENIVQLNSLPSGPVSEAIAKAKEEKEAQT